MSNRTRWGRIVSGAGLLVACLHISLPASAATLAPGDILVSDLSSETVIQVDPVSGAQTLLVPAGTIGALGIALGAGGELYVSSAAGAIHELDPMTGVLTPVSSDGLLRFPSDMVSTPAGDLLVVDRVTRAVFAVDPGTGAQTPISSGGLIDFPHSIALESDGNILVANQSAVIRIDAVTGDQTVLSSGGLFALPLGVAVDAGGEVLVADANAGTGGAVLRVDAVTGDQTLISTAGFFDDPQELVVDGNGDLLVLDRPANAVIRVDPTTGSQTIISSGGDFVEPIDIALVPVPAISSRAFALLDLLFLSWVASRTRSSREPARWKATGSSWNRGSIRP